MHPVTQKQEIASASGDSKSVVAGDVIYCTLDEGERVLLDQTFS